MDVFILASPLSHSGSFPALFSATSCPSHPDSSRLLSLRFSQLFPCTCTLCPSPPGAPRASDAAFSSALVPTHAFYACIHTSNATPYAAIPLAFLCAPVASSLSMLLRSCLSHFELHCSDFYAPPSSELRRLWGAGIVSFHGSFHPIAYKIQHGRGP